MLHRINLLHQLELLVVRLSDLFCVVRQLEIRGLYPSRNLLELRYLRLNRMKLRHNAAELVLERIETLHVSIKLLRLFFKLRPEPV